MTEEYAVVEAQPVVEEEPAPLEPGNCRWCGAYHEPADGETSDWQCAECERYQDAMICPTCNGLARVSLLPADMVPAPASPKRGKR